MKKTTTLLLLLCFVLIALLPVIATGCTPRENTLKIYNWDEYIDESILEDFEDYYFQVTGEKVKVKYKVFKTNEIMLNKIAGKQSDYDLICPSDYMIEKMARLNLLKELQTDLGNDANGVPIVDYRTNTSDFFNNLFEYDPTGKYSVPYMWGTMGILYNSNEVNLSYLQEKGWGALWGTEYKDTIAMKDSYRDSYAIASLYAFKNPSSPHYNADMTITQALNATDDASIAIIEQVMKTQKPLLYGYEVDTGKQEMIDGTINMSLQWSGDAIYAIDQAVEQHSSSALDYYVPEEGSNIWSDGWCIPAYAVNEKAANMFINFICRPDIAIRNMEFIGYTSSVASPEILEYLAENADESYEELDLSYFFGAAGAKVKASLIQYPSQAIIDRCAIMKDYGDRNDAIEQSWSRVKNS